jgi:hypothetical protein
MIASTHVKINTRKIMAKKSRSKKETCCHSCLTSATFNELNPVQVPMHRGVAEGSLYGIYVCDKCLTKYQK